MRSGSRASDAAAEPKAGSGDEPGTRRLDRQFGPSSRRKVLSVAVNESRIGHPGIDLFLCCNRAIYMGLLDVPSRSLDA